jgi:hypothetical protein
MQNTKPARRNRFSLPFSVSGGHALLRWLLNWACQIFWPKGHCMLTNLQTEPGRMPRPERGYLAEPRTTDKLSKED